MWAFATILDTNYKMAGLQISIKMFTWSAEDVVEVDNGVAAFENVQLENKKKEILNALTILDCLNIIGGYQRPTNKNQKPFVYKNCT